ncbi:hypothetical protein [Caballeronia sp. RCC_10]|jgi:hypothetical protein|uniref:hypothetical protein n=1 Tax=Caballeronia sp. RCC_10 TaxID=3239227 RepID=UPI00352451B8
MAFGTSPPRRYQTSGIYKVVKEGAGGSGFEVTCVEGEHFPPNRSGKGAHYELVRAVTHSHKHSELGSGDQLQTGIVDARRSVFCLSSAQRACQVTSFL